MRKQDFEANGLPVHEFDWEGNNAAITCPPCGKVYVVSAMMHPKGRECPKCGKSTGHVKGGKQSGGSAYVEWEDSN